MRRNEEGERPGIVKVEAVSCRRECVSRKLSDCRREEEEGDGSNPLPTR